MARLAGLVDLSLFATSPADDRHFATPYLSPSQRAQRETPCYHTQSNLNATRQWNSASKPLPPLPPQRLCGRRPRARRGDPASRCILTRIKRARVEGAPGGGRGQTPTLQQRRISSVAPLLTLSLPQSGREPESDRPSRPTMIWMPDDQMWLIQEDANHNTDPHRWSYVPPLAPYLEHHYTRSEPSPGTSGHFDLPPLSPPPYTQPMHRDEPPDQIRNQFLRLIGTHNDDEERLSSLFQEAIQSVPPMTDPSLATPQPIYTLLDDWNPQRLPGEDPLDEDDWLSNTSVDRSYHTARASFHGVGEEEGSSSVYSQVSHANPWQADDPAEPTSTVSQITQDSSWAEEPPSVISQLSRDASWGWLAGPITRPRSSMN